MAVALLAPPGVGLVPRGSNGTSAIDRNPDASAELLSLSIRDGLSIGGFQIWPLLAALQVLLLGVIVGAFAARKVIQATKPGD